MLDTNICIYVLKNRSDQLRHKFNVMKDLCVSVVTYAELCFGVEHGPAELKAHRWQQLESFVSLLSIETLDAEVGHHYGRMRAHLQIRGRPIGNNDLVIAAHAQRLGAVLVTNNVREFARVPDLSVENWL